LLANAKGIPSVITTHAPFLEPKLRKFYLRLLVNINDLTFGKVLLSMVDRIIVISNWEIKYLLKLSAKKEKIRVIPNGVPKEFFRKVDGNSFRKKFNLHKKVILFFGRVHPVKGLDVLIKAVPLLSEEVNVVVVGPYEKDYYSELNSLIKSLKIENIVFTGPVKSLKEKIGVYSACDLFVLPSLREAFPLTLLEAMAIGKPVISSETNGAKEVIKDGYNGLFFKTGDPKDLANKINLLLSDRSMQRRLGENGKKVARNYTWDKIVDKIEDVYKEIV
jgi:glycosyltransferase involved in cell wall biosynthesis